MDTIPEPSSACPLCGAAIAPGGRGRPRVICRSPRCRRAYQAIVRYALALERFVERMQGRPGYRARVMKAQQEAAALRARVRPQGPA